MMTNKLTYLNFNSRGHSASVMKYTLKDKVDDVILTPLIDNVMNTHITIHGGKKINIGAKLTREDKTKYYGKGVYIDRINNEDIEKLKRFCRDNILWKEPEHGEDLMIMPFSISNNNCMFQNKKNTYISLSSIINNIHLDTIYSVPSGDTKKFFQENSFEGNQICQIYDTTSECIIGYYIGGLLINAVSIDTLTKIPVFGEIVSGIAKAMDDNYHYYTTLNKDEIQNQDNFNKVMQDCTQVFDAQSMIYGSLKVRKFS